MTEYIRIIRIIQCISIAFIVLFTASCKTSQKVQKADQKPVVVAPPPPKAEPVKEIKVEKKDEVVQMKVALIMPFELEMNFSDTAEKSSEPIISNSSLSALNFYEGAQIAADSLKGFKRDVKIVAYDTPADSIGLVRMMSGAAMKDVAYVVGTFPNNLVSAAVHAAEKANVKLMLTQAGSPSVIKDNPNSALAFASTITQCRELVSYMLNEYPDSKLILVYRTAKREDELAEFFRDEITRLKWSHEFVEIKPIEKGYKDIVPLLSKTKRNVVFLVSSDEAFVSPVLSLIEDQNIFGVMVAGLPTWQNFESIDFMALKNVQVFLFDNNFISYTSTERSSFRKTFISKYQSDPLANGFNGFDIVFNMGLAYDNKDQKFQMLIKKAFSKDEANFNFTQTGSGGLENKSISVLKFKDFYLERINLK